MSAKEATKKQNTNQFKETKVPRKEARKKVQPKFPESHERDVKISIRKLHCGHELYSGPETTVLVITNKKDGPARQDCRLVSETFGDETAKAL